MLDHATSNKLQSIYASLNRAMLDKALTRADDRELYGLPQKENPWTDECY